VSERCAKAREFAEATNARLCMPTRHLYDEAHNANTYTERVNLGLSKRFMALEQERGRAAFENVTQMRRAKP
jgi:hypothetical protein